MSRHLTTATLLLALATSLTACGGGSDESAPAVDPTVSALSGQLPESTGSAAELPARMLPPDAAATLDASLMPPT